MKFFGLVSLFTLSVLYVNIHAMNRFTTATTLFSTSYDSCALLKTMCMIFSMLHIQSEGGHCMSGILQVPHNIMKYLVCKNVNQPKLTSI